MFWAHYCALSVKLRTISALVSSHAPRSFSCIVSGHRDGSTMHCNSIYKIFNKRGKKKFIATDKVNWIDCTDQYGTDSTPKKTDKDKTRDTRATNASEIDGVALCYDCSDIHYVSKQWGNRASNVIKPIRMIQNRLKCSIDAKQCAQLHRVSDTSTETVVK